jgi:NAD(P)-dependent dehydrogenase (short-subunit alcohol dehydrogenase family)
MNLTMAPPDFRGQVAWITGASSGIGRALALELARHGADVAISARRVDRLQELAAAIEALQRRCLVVPCDVTDEAAVAAAVARIVERLGRLDVAVANAGFAVSGRVEELSAADWRRQLDTNVVGAALTARHALPELRRTAGRLVLVGSVASMMTGPKSGAYAASKYAVRALGQTLAMELHGSGVSCTTLHPGFVDSEIARVDNQGRFDPARTDRRPARLMWPAERAAQVMVRAIWQRRGEYVFTGHGKLAGFLGRHWPGLVQFAQTRKPVRRRASPRTTTP